jgi:hypothetical protein
MLYALEELAASDSVIASRTKGGRSFNAPAFFLCPKRLFGQKPDFLGKRDFLSKATPTL